MMQSMTGFARHGSQGKWGTATWEVRSVNHRYLDLSLRVPEAARELEGVFREIIHGNVRRGKVEATLKFQPGEMIPTKLHVNSDMLKQLKIASDQVKEVFTTIAPVNVVPVLGWPGVLQVEEVDIAPAKNPLIHLLNETVKELVAARQREGAAIKQVLHEQLIEMKREIDKIRHRLPDVVRAERQRLDERIQAAKVEVDEQRFEQEIVLLMQKMDVTEELDRLDVHLEEVKRVLNTDSGGVGRRLDFLIQELHREANTLTSKSVDVQVTQSAVELKVLIERMREQVQNIE